MKNKVLIVFSILAVCWEELLKHTHTWKNQATDHLWVNEEEHTISVLQNGPEYKEIYSVIEVRELLLRWIDEWLTESEMVILHTDHKNGEISLHRPADFY